jgi:SAM-dependent methyltransferase
MVGALSGGPVNEWEAIHQSRHWGTYPEVYMVRQVKAFMRQCSNTGTIHALDIGCGAGAHTWMMSREGMSVWALDVSPTALSRLREIPCMRCLGDVNTYESFQPSQFDFILDNVSLTYEEKPDWQRILGWLKPGGWLVSASFSHPPKNTPPAWHHPIGDLIGTYSFSGDDDAWDIKLHKYVK